MLYFVLGCSVLAAVIFPHWREALRERLHAWRHGALNQSRRIERGMQRSHTRLAAGATQSAQAVQTWWRTRWMWVALTLGLLVAPLAVVTAWSLMGARSLDGFDDRIDPGNQQVLHLLRGEQLVPPPPLPPDVFTTVEVEVVRPMLSSADRRWDQMDADFVQRLLAIPFDRLRKRRFQVREVGVRTPANFMVFLCGQPHQSCFRTRPIDHPDMFVRFTNPMDVEEPRRYQRSRS